MRHTFASWAIAAGLPTFEIAATMGTSLEQLSKTYAHLLPDSADRARLALDTFLATSEATEDETFGHRVGTTEVAAGS
jgi:integrase